MAEIIDLGSVRDRDSIDLATTKNRRIPNARRTERSPEAMAAAKELILRHHPNAKLRSLTAAYNCVGMAFDNRRTCIEPDHLPTILHDDGFREVSPAEVAPGDVVVYHDDDGRVSHVAVVVAHTPDVASADWKTTVLSQWGADGEYLHDHVDVNKHLGRPDRFYSERKKG